MKDKCICAALLLASTFSHGTLTISLQEVGSDVVASYSGSLDLSSISPAFTDTPGSPNLRAENPLLVVGSGGNVDFYNVFISPSGFGPGNSATNAPSSTSGDLVGISSTGIGDFLIVPAGSDGSSLSGSATWVGESFASLGVTIGTYQYDFTGDSLIIQAVPEPAHVGLLLGGTVFAALLFIKRRKRS